MKINSKNPKISVVIPAYNEEKFIEQTLISLKNQTYKYFDIIVVDNNSQDKTAAIARRFGAKVLKETKQGYVFTANKGLLKAEADILAATDADTLTDSKWLEAIVKTLQDPKIVSVTGPAKINSPSWLLNKIIPFLFTIFLKLNFLLGKPHLSGFNFAVKKAAFHKIGGFNTDYKMSADVDLGLRLSQVGKVVFNDNMIVTTSTRRWSKGLIKPLWEYTKGYFFPVWLRRPVEVKQEAIR